MGDEIKDSQIVIAIADLASKGKYDNVTPVAARQMDALFQLVAALINKLEAAENLEAAEAELVEGTPVSTPDVPGPTDTIRKESPSE